MTAHQRIIAKFGGVSALAKLLGHARATTVAYWRDHGIPRKHWDSLVDLAQKRAIKLRLVDFIR